MHRLAVRAFTKSDYQIGIGSALNVEEAAMINAG